MDYEKEYKKIVGKIKKAYLHALTDSTNAVLEEILPELAESEDEKVRKWLINDIKQAINGDIYNDENIIDAKKALAFLEKQGEKHPDPYNGISFEYNGHIWGMCARDNGVDISCDKHLIKHLEKQAEVKESTISQHENKTCEENGNSLTYEDEKVRKELLDFCKNRAEKYSNDPKYKNISAWITWLKSLRPQPKQKWREEDSAMVEDIVKNLKKLQLQMPNYRVELQMRWLKSLRPQNHWKPSDEQIKVCKEVYADILSAKGFDLGTVNSELNRMEEQLKKLKEENI